MSAQDPIADLLTRIRNAQRVGHPKVSVSSSKLKEAVVSVLKEEGYIENYQITESSRDTAFGCDLEIRLKYYHGKPVITSITRKSKPGLRLYKPAKALLPIPGFGIAILSTSQGVMSHLKAKRLNVGGEVLCEVA